MNINVNYLDYSRCNTGSAIYASIGKGFPGSSPHLMKRICNNLGSSTVVTYKPSTYYSCKNKGEGKLWKTKLPFPMHCVSRIETIDKIAETVSTTNCTYHEEFSSGIKSDNLIHEAQICEILQVSPHCM